MTTKVTLTEILALPKDEVQVFDKERVFWTWYPQMGGYVAKAVIEFAAVSGDGESGAGCFDALVFHDGDWPFKTDREPRGLHHCAAEQFIEFGITVLEAQAKFQHGLNGRPVIEDPRTRADIQRAIDRLQKLLGGS